MAQAASIMYKLRLIIYQIVSCEGQVNVVQQILDSSHSYSFELGAKSQESHRKIVLANENARHYYATGPLGKYKVFLILNS